MKFHFTKNKVTSYFIRTNWPLIVVTIKTSPYFMTTYTKQRLLQKDEDMLIPKNT